MSPHAVLTSGVGKSTQSGWVRMRRTERDHMPWLEMATPSQTRTCIMFKTHCGDAYFDWLRTIELFADCSDRELAEVMRFATVLDVPAGRTLTRQGDVGRECFVTTE